MKIEIEVDNFENFINGFQNAFIAYKDIRNGIWLFGGMPDGIHPKWNKLINKEAEDFDGIVKIFDIRLKELENVYKQLEKKERLKNIYKQLEEKERELND